MILGCWWASGHPSLCTTVTGMPRKVTLNPSEVLSYTLHTSQVPDTP